MLERLSFTKLWFLMSFPCLSSFPLPNLQLGLSTQQLLLWTLLKAVCIIRVELDVMTTGTLAKKKKKKKR